MNIERIRMGDMVLAKHQTTGEVRLQPVLRTSIREPEPLIRITLEDASHAGSGQGTTIIRASGGHPFWVSGSGWLRARLLTAGMQLHCLSGVAVIKKVELEDTPARTYNLIVEDFHSYFVSNLAVMSHDNTMVQPTLCKVPGLAP